MYLPKEFWAGRADEAPIDGVGFAPVLHPDAPFWFNRLIDNLQFRAIRRALAIAGLSTPARILDVGCGTGRWLRRYQKLGLLPTGIDSTPAMLDLARQSGTATPLIVGEAHRLPFRNEVFDYVSDITVVQHIPADLQPKALGEMLRVLRPGGRLILMELIRGKDPHIFPRAPHDWIAETAAHGGKLVGWFGQEYLLFDRLLVHTARSLSGKNRASMNVSGGSQYARREPSLVVRQVYWGARRVAAPLSAFMDRFVGTICPPEIATHGVFIFQK